MIYKIFIISIERNIERYKSIQKKLIYQGFKEEDIIICLGLDYKTTSDEEIKLIKSKYGIFTPSPVLCCAASHILTWEYIYKYSTINHIDYAIILEDDSYLIKPAFDEYRNIIERRIDDFSLLNFSNAFSPKKFNETEDNDEFFTKVFYTFALDTYIITPNLAKKLSDYYIDKKISYHIDIHLLFTQNEINFDIYKFNKNIKKDDKKFESSMVQNHDKKFILKQLQGQEIYKDINTPIIEHNKIVINGYNIIVVFLFIIITMLVFHFYTYDSPIYVYIIFSILYFLLGLCFYDVL